MRAIHLVGLPGPDGISRRYTPPNTNPLTLPWTIPAGDQEQIVAYYQHTIGDSTLPRIEFDWLQDGISEASVRYALSERSRVGSSGLLLVVKVRCDGVDAREIHRHDVVRMFEHIVIAGGHELLNSELGNALSLTKHVERTLRDLYGEIAERMQLREDGWEAARLVARELANPVDLVELANGLIDIQLEVLATPSGTQPSTAEMTPTLKSRLLSRLLQSQSAERLAVLLAYAIGMPRELERLFPSYWSEGQRALTSEMLLRDGRLSGWATWLSESSVDVRSAVRRAGVRFENSSTWQAILSFGKERHVASVSVRTLDENATYDRLKYAALLTQEGRLSQARGELERIEPRVAAIGSPALSSQFGVLAERIRVPDPHVVGAASEAWDRFASMSSDERSSLVPVLGNGFNARIVYGPIGLPTHSRLARLWRATDWPTTVERALYRSGARIASDRVAAHQRAGGSLMLLWDAGIAEIAAKTGMSYASSDRRLKVALCALLDESLPASVRQGVAPYVDHFIQQGSFLDVVSYAQDRLLVDSIHPREGYGLRGQTRIWCPNGHASVPSSIVMGVRDVQKFVNGMDKSVQRLALDARRETGPLRGRSWMDLMLACPLLFLGKSLDMVEWPIWWILARRARFSRSSNPPPVFALVLNSHGADHGALLANASAVGMRLLVCDSWPEGWERIALLLRSPDRSIPT